MPGNCWDLYRAPFSAAFPRREIVFLNGVFSLRDFRRLVVDALLVMADGGVGLRNGASSENKIKAIVGERVSY
jgi:hypothetical protein